MLIIKDLTVKNFMSVGNQTQAISFNNKHLILVIGENMDLGGDDAGARNGTGKTTIINALSYVFFGEALTNIRRDNLVNKTNEKNMLVSVNFIKNNVTYTIERGRKPQTLKFFANNIEQNTESNEAQGENKETQHEINRLLGMTHAMFKNIIALNTYTQPFLATKQAEQREIIEQLLGITLLSQKAELLKDQQRATRTELTEEKIKIESILASNEKIQESIESLKLRSSAWQQQKTDDTKKFQQAITELEKVDINKELDAHKKLAKHTDDMKTLKSLEKEKAYHEHSLTKAETQVDKTEKDLGAYSAAAILPDLLRNHGLIKAAQSDLDAANERKREAFGAWFPNLVVGSHWAYEDNNKAPGSDDTKMYARGLDLTATQLLWDFGGANAGVRIADLTHNIAEDNLEVARQDLLLRAITAYLNYKRAGDVLKFAGQSERNIRKQTDLELSLIHI